GVYWSKDPQVDSTLTSTTTSRGSLAFQDTDGAVTAYVDYPDGYLIHDIDLTGATYESGRGGGQGDLLPAASTEGESWAGTIYDVTILPSSTGPIGTQLEIDWIRLYNPTDSPDLTFNWSTSGADANWDFVRLYVDNDNSGYDGDLLISAITDDGSYTIETGALPPGTYYFYLTLCNRSGSSITTEAYSGYSGKLTIGSAPSIEFTSPSFTSGVDYAETVIGDAWDMSSSTEVRYSEDIYSGTYSTGILSATTGSYSTDDSQIWFNTRARGRVLPVVADDFRYLTFKMKVETAGYTNIGDRVKRGWVSRLIWSGTEDLTTFGSYSKDVPILEDWHTYAVDLWDPELLETNSLIPTVAQYGWDAADTLSLIRFDPLEVEHSTQFYVDYVKIHKMNETENNSYTIRWNSADADSSSATITLEYGTVDSYGTFTKVGDIATLSGEAFGSGSTDWDTSSVTEGDYYIRASVNDGSHIVRRISKAPVRVEAAETDSNLIWEFGWGWPGAETVPGDYDGDGISDLAVFDQNSGGWYIITTEGEYLAWGIAWGWPGALPVEGDYDGDGRSDLAVMDTASGYWYVYSLRGEYLEWAFEWGWSTAVPVPGDYDNDAKHDYAVFDSANGYWYVAGSAGGGVFGYNWGWYGAIPVAGDYDGDQIADYAVFDSNTGYWYIMSSTGTLIAWEVQWGWPGAEPVPGDYDNDGVSDLAIYDQNTGYWFVYSLTNGVVTWYLGWGWPGAEVVHGTYLGDAASDYAVMDSATGYWYILENEN
ncbi:hypothetical protein BVX94_02940, partial [bacterium B17]